MGVVKMAAGLIVAWTAVDETVTVTNVLSKRMAVPKTKLFGLPLVRIGSAAIVPAAGVPENEHMLVHAALAETANAVVEMAHAYNCVLPSNTAVLVAQTEIVPRLAVPRKRASGAPVFAKIVIPCGFAVVMMPETAMVA